jgi:hypothetical protein
MSKCNLRDEDESARPRHPTPSPSMCCPCQTSILLMHIHVLHPILLNVSNLFPNIQLSHAFSSLIFAEPTIPNNSIATASFAKPTAPVFTNAFTPSHQGHSSPAFYAAIHARALEGTRTSLKSKLSIGISSQKNVASSVLRPDRSILTSKAVPATFTEGISELDLKRESCRNTASSSADYRDDTIISGSNDSLCSAIRASFDAIAQVAFYSDVFMRVCSLLS